MTHVRSAENIVQSNRSAEYLDILLTKLQDSRPHVKLMAYLVSISATRKLAGDGQTAFAQKLLDAMDINEISGIDDNSQEHLALSVSIET